jgi:chromosomal replication initiation ATPase DnaA
LPHGESLSRDNFLESESNSAAYHLVSAWPDWPNRIMWLTGLEGSGKTHLATIWALDAGARVVSAHALTAERVPEALATGALVLDDVGTKRLDERALFHLINLAREQNAYVLLVSRFRPVDIPSHLPDLASRLRALPTVELEAPDDVMLRALIVKFAADRQLALDESVVGYVAARIERSAAAARRIVEQLDVEALRLGRPVTRSLAAGLLNEG